MSGGLAFVLDETGEFARTQCNPASVDLEPLVEADDIAKVRALIEKHLALTGSPRAAWILDNWMQTWPKFLKVFPHELKRVLAVEREKKASVGEVHLPGVLVAMAAGAEQVRHG
jgi:glutamate synthase domain-containing protein 3